MTFDKERTGTGTMEWAEVNENICIGCPNDCLYCYAAANAKRFKLRDRKQWHVEELTKRAEIKSYPSRDGVIMFPSSHDITPFNVEQYIRVAKLMLGKGNKLLIVSKPRLECIEKLLDAFVDFKDQILFRFTIGSMDKSIVSFWEPGAPPPSERIECLNLAYSRGFKTSVSIEPMLGGIHSTIRVVESVAPFINETIWIGKMNRARLRVNPTTENRHAVYGIEKLQSDDEIIDLYHYYENNQNIRWKDSIKEVVGRRQGGGS